MSKRVVPDVVAKTWLEREERRNKEGSVTNKELQDYITDFRENTIVVKAGYNEHPEDLSKYNIKVRLQ